MDLDGRAPLDADMPQLSHLAGVDGQTLARVRVDDGERAQLSPFGQRVGHEGHAPDVVGGAGRLLGLAQFGGLVATCGLLPVRWTRTEAPWACSNSTGQAYPRVDSRRVRL